MRIDGTGDGRCKYGSCPVPGSKPASYLPSRDAVHSLLGLFCWSLLGPFLDAYERVVGIYAGSTTGVGLAGSLEVGAR
jgi:hypothetical protein